MKIMNGAADKSRSYNQCMEHTRFTYVIILFNRMLMFVKIDSTPSSGSRFSAKKPQNSIMIINFESHRAQAFFCGHECAQVATSERKRQEHEERL